MNWEILIEVPAPAVDPSLGTDVLLVEGTQGLVEGWCGPAYSVEHDRLVLMGWSRPPGGPDGDEFAVSATVVQTGSGCWVRPPDVCLDLRRSEARDRVLRVLALQLAPEGADLVSCSSGRWFAVWPHNRPEWTLEIERIVTSKRGTRSGGVFQLSFMVQGLDPADNERLPDGSRLVDARAMAMAARQVLHG